MLCCLKSVRYERIKNGQRKISKLKCNKVGIVVDKQHTFMPPVGLVVSKTSLPNS
jgi:hypothetical protein